jgi:hypothetical protein
MSNTNLTSTIITRKALDILHNNLVFTRTINRQYDDQFAKSGAKIGDTLKIRKPVRVNVREGVTMNAQDAVETSEDLVVSTRRGVDLNFTSTDLTMDIDDFADRYLKPSMAKLASKIDFLALTEYQNIYSQVGAPGTTPAAALVWLQANQKLNEMAAPDDEMRYACINPAAQASTVNGLTALFNPNAAISSQYTKGSMGTALGLNFGMTQNINTHTNGAFSGTTLVDEGGGVTEGDEVITVDAFTDSAPTVKKGDIFTIAAVFAVNPETGASTGSLQQFVVTADTTGSSNEINIPVSPAFKASTSDPYQTIDALPLNEAAVTFAGVAEASHPINMVHHKDAITLATADLELPNGVDFAAREVHEGISMRIVRDYDVVNDQFPCRIDVHFGIKTVRPELACRVTG